jgi:hypothetical protein
MEEGEGSRRDSDANSRAVAIVLHGEESKQKGSRTMETTTLDRSTGQ